MSDSPSHCSPRTTVPFASTGVGTQNATEMSGESKSREAAQTTGTLHSPLLPPFHVLREASNAPAHVARSPDLPPLVENIGSEFVEVRPRLPPVETLPGYHGVRYPSSNRAGPSSRVVTSRKRGRDLETGSPAPGFSPTPSSAQHESEEDSSHNETRRKRRRLNDNTSSPATATSADVGARESVNVRPGPVLPLRRERSRLISTNGILEAGEVIEVGYTPPHSSLSPRRGRQFIEVVYRPTRRVVSPALLRSRQAARSSAVDSVLPSVDRTQWVPDEGVVPEAAPHSTVVGEQVLDGDQVFETGIPRLERQNAILNSVIPPPSDFRRRYPARVMRTSRRSSNPPMRSTALRPRRREQSSTRSVTAESAPIPESTIVTADSIHRPPRVMRTSRRPPVGRPRRARMAAYFRTMNVRDLTNFDDQIMRQRNAAPKAVIAALPEAVATEADTEIRCAICMCDVEVGENLRILPCTHRYHKKCIEDWLSYNACCPMDKQRICPVQPIRPNDLF